VPTIQGMVEERGTYKLENVMVGFNEGNYKLLPHKYKLNMMGNARFTKVKAINVPRNVFEFSGRVLFSSMVSCTLQFPESLQNKV